MNRWRKYLLLPLLLAAAAAPCRAAVTVYSFGSGLNCQGQWPVPDTSTKPYIAATGDDSYYQPVISSPSYKVNGDGTTTDKVTGLMWVTNPGSVPYNWQTALSSCTGTTSGNMNFGAGFAGYADWRLPDAKELLSILDFGETVAPAINRTAFPGTVSGMYWTSTTQPSAPSSALAVRFDGYGLAAQAKTGNATVRCVRGNR